MRIWVLAMLLVVVYGCAQHVGGAERERTGAEAGAVEMPVAQAGATEGRATFEALDKKVESFSIEKMPLDAALEKVAREWGVKVWVNWNVVESAGGKRDEPVSVKMEGVPARQILHAILSQGGSADLQFVVDDNVVIVSTRDELSSAKYQVVAVYDVREFFADVELDSPEAQALAGAIMDTIKATVEPDSWRDAGGTVGSIRVLNGQLIINQSVDGQEQVAAFIKAFKAQRPKATRTYDVRDLLKGDGTDGGKAKVQALIEAIEANCGRDTWRDHGGKTSSVAFFEGRLYVTTKPAVHEQIERLLAMMRK